MFLTMSNLHTNCWLKLDFQKVCQHTWEAPYFCNLLNISASTCDMKVWYFLILILWLHVDMINTLRPSDAIWRQWSWTTLAQVMACCLTAPSHYLNQCWLIIRGVLWHSSEKIFAGIAQGINSGYQFEKDILKIIFKSPRGQWVKQSTTPMFTTMCCNDKQRKPGELHMPVQSCREPCFPTY